MRSRPPSQGHRSYQARAGALDDLPGRWLYRGKKFPELRGAYVFGDWETRRLWAARFEGDRTKEMPEIAWAAVIGRQLRLGSVPVA